jgi:hypothetical protein
MERIDTIYGAVVSALETIPETRSSDKRLILEVYKSMGINTHKPFAEVLQNEVPSTETIIRCRRRAQARNPKLAATDKVQKFRASLEAEHRELAIENGAL